MYMRIDLQPLCTRRDAVIVMQSYENHTPYSTRVIRHTKQDKNPMLGFPEESISAEGVIDNVLHRYEKYWTPVLLSA